MPHQFITFYLYYRKDWFGRPACGAGGQDQWLAFMEAGGARLADASKSFRLDSNAWPCG